jgi:hypothetical protein
MKAAGAFFRNDVTCFPTAASLLHRPGPTTSADLSLYAVRPAKLYAGPPTCTSTLSYTNDGKRQSGSCSRSSPKPHLHTNRVVVGILPWARNEISPAFRFRFGEPVSRRMLRDCFQYRRVASRSGDCHVASHHSSKLHAAGQRVSCVVAQRAGQCVGIRTYIWVSA